MRDVFYYRKLKGKITEKCGTQREFAEKMGLSENSVSNKLSRNRNWTQDEMLKACEILSIPVSKMHLFFYGDDAQRN